MANWQRTLNLLPEWREVRDGDITAHTMAAVIASRLRELDSFNDPTGLDYDRDDIAERFEDFASDQDATIEDFDEILAALYDWADTPLSNQNTTVFRVKKACWIKTF